MNTSTTTVRGAAEVVKGFFIARCQKLCNKSSVMGIIPEIAAIGVIATAVLSGIAGAVVGGVAGYLVDVVIDQCCSSVRLRTANA